MKSLCGTQVPLSEEGCQGNRDESARHLPCFAPPLAVDGKGGGGGGGGGGNRGGALNSVRVKGTANR